jgi:heme exporter protein D
MNWTSFGEFIAMGGYGLYVWGSFGMCALVLAGELIALRLRRNALRQRPFDGSDHASPEAQR